MSKKIVDTTLRDSFLERIKKPVSATHYGEATHRPYCTGSLNKTEYTAFAMVATCRAPSHPYTNILLQEKIFSFYALGDERDCVAPVVDFAQDGV